MLTEPLRYDNQNDVQARISQTIIRYKSRPVYVSDLLENLKISVFDPTLGEQYTVHSSDTELDVRAFPLGFMNSSGKGLCSFVMRMPTRRHRQGLCSENTMLEAVSSGPTNGHYSDVSTRLLTSLDFFRMLRGDYPSIQEALRKVYDSKNEEVSHAFSRKLCLSRDEIGLVKLHFLNTPIAVHNKRKELFILTERFARYEPLLKEFELPCEVV